MISVATQANSQVTAKPSSQRTTPKTSVVKQDTRIDPIKALSFGAVSTLLGSPAEGLSMGLGMAALDKTGGTRFIDRTLDRLGVDKFIGDLGEKSGLFKLMNSTSERLGLYTPAKVPFANDVKGLFSDVIEDDIAQAQLDRDKVLYIEDKSKYPSITKRAEDLSQKILAKNYSSFSHSDKKPSGDVFRFDVRSSKIIDIPPPIRNGNASWKVYQATDGLAMEGAQAYVSTRSSNNDGVVKMIRLTDSNQQTLSVFLEGKDADSLKTTAIHIYKHDEQAQKAAA